MTKQLVEIAAQIYSCKVEELLSYREYEDGSVVIIAPTGQKFTYSAEQIMKRILENAEESSKATVPIAAPFEKGGEEMVSEVGQVSAEPVTKEMAPVVTAAGAADPSEVTKGVSAAESGHKNDSAHVASEEAPEVTKNEIAPVVTGAPNLGGAGVTKESPPAPLEKGGAAKKKRPTQSKATGSVSK